MIPPSSTTRTRKLLAAAILCTGFGAVGSYAFQSSTRTYDSTTDTTFVTLEPSALVDDAGKPTGLTLHVFGSFSGEDGPRDSMISIGMISVSRNWQFSGDMDRLELTLDGKLIKIGPLRHEWTTTPDGSVFQQTWAEIPPDVVLSIVRAASFRGRFGPMTFAFTPQQRDAIRTLATDLSSKE